MTLKDKVIEGKPPKIRTTIKSLLLTDFGTAKKIVKETSQHTFKVGTLTHMAPEVHTKKEYDPKLADGLSFFSFLFFSFFGSLTFFICSLFLWNFVVRTSLSLSYHSTW